MGKEGRDMITQIFKQTAAYKVMIIVFLLFTLMFIVTIHSLIISRSSTTQFTTSAPVVDNCSTTSANR